MVLDLATIKLIFIAFAALAVLFYWLFNFVVLYHLARFGVGVQPKRLAAVFLFGSTVLFMAFTILFLNVDLNEFIF